MNLLSLGRPWFARIVVWVAVVLFSPTAARAQTENIQGLRDYPVPEARSRLDRIKANAESLDQPLVIDEIPEEWTFGDLLTQIRRNSDIRVSIDFGSFARAGVTSPDEFPIPDSVRGSKTLREWLAKTLDTMETKPRYLVCEQFVQVFVPDEKFFEQVLSHRIECDFLEMPAEEMIDTLAARSGLRVKYCGRDKLPKVFALPVSPRLNNAKISTALQVIADEARLRIRRDGDTLVVALIEEKIAELTPRDPNEFIRPPVREDLPTRHDAASPATTINVNKVLAIRHLLSEPSRKMGGGIDPGTPLCLALDQMAAEHGLKMRLHAPSYLEHGIGDPGNLAFSLPPMRNVSVGTMLKDLLCQRDPVGEYAIRNEEIIVFAVGDFFEDFLDERINLDCEDMAVGEIMEALSSWAGLRLDRVGIGIMYEPFERRVSIKIRNLRLREAIQIVAAEADLQAYIGLDFDLCVGLTAETLHRLGMPPRTKKNSPLFELSKNQAESFRLVKLEPAPESDLLELAFAPAIPDEFERKLRERITVNLDKVDAPDAIRKFAETAKLNIVFDAERFREPRPITLQLKDVTAETALVLLAELSGLTAYRVDDVILLSDQFPENDKVRPLVPEKDWSPNARLMRAIHQPTSAAFDPGTPLETTLEFLGKRHGITIRIDNNAFRMDGGPKNIGEIAICLNPMRNIPLGSILDELLGQLKPQCAYVVRDGHLVITTRAAIESGEFLKELIHKQFDKSPLDDACRELSERTGVAILLDKRFGDKAKTPVTATLRGTPLITAVEFLADQADARAVARDGTLYITSPENAVRLEKENEERKKKDAKGGLGLPNKD